MPWIAWFCSLGGHQYFAEVADEFVEDDFNLTGLNSIVPFYKEALDMILDLEPGNLDNDSYVRAKTCPFFFPDIWAPPWLFVWILVY